jgi:hypothetical protein
LATGGQQEFTGLTGPGDTIFQNYVAECKAAREVNRNRRFEKNHLLHFQATNDIQCGSYEDDVKRRKRANPQAGIATDTPAQLAYDDSHLYAEELANAGDDMSV